jgi:hypothetical protein
MAEPTSSLNTQEIDETKITTPPAVTQTSTLVQPSTNKCAASRKLFLDDDVAFEGSKTGTDLQFLSARYDKFYQNMETLDAIFLALTATASTAGAVSTGIGVALLPVVMNAMQFVSILSKGAQLFPGKYMNSKEMTYLSSACLGFVNSIMQDVVEMNQFYGLDIVKSKGYEPDEATFKVLQQNLYKYMHFLIKQINFQTVDEENEKQDLFWVGMFQKVYFKDYTFRKENDEMKRNPPPLGAPTSILFRYSFAGCHPEGMRTKLRTKSVMGITDGDAIKYGSPLLKTPVTEEDKETYIKNRNEKCDLTVADCNNYNDFLMQMLEYKAHVLIKSQYNRFKNNFKFNIFTDVLNDESKIRLKDNYTKYLKGKKTNIFISIFKKKNILTDAVIERMVAFNFPNLIDMIGVLQRFITELEVKEKELLSFYNSVGGYMVGGGNVRDMILGSPVQNYREMLREYTIMTANFGLVTARYNIHCNKLILEDGVTSADYKASLAKFLQERKITEPEIKAAIEQVSIGNIETLTSLDKAAGGEEVLSIEDNLNNQTIASGGKTRRKQKSRPRLKLGSTRRRRS